MSTQTALRAAPALPMTIAPPAQIDRLPNPSGHFWWWGATIDTVKEWAASYPEWELLHLYEPGALGEGLPEQTWLSYGLPGSTTSADFYFDGGRLVARQFWVQVARSAQLSLDLNEYMLSLPPPDESEADGLPWIDKARHARLNSGFCANEEQPVLMIMQYHIAPIPAAACDVRAALLNPSLQ